MGYLMPAALREREVRVEWRVLTKKVEVAARRT